MNIGIIGTGLLGSSIAIKLSKSDNNVYAYNRSREKLEPLKEHGIKILNSPNEIFNYCDYVISVLSDFKAYKNTFSNLERFENKIFLQMSTLSPKESIELNNFFKQKNISYLESPVLGSKKEAESGKLIIMCSGEKDIFEKSINILKILSENYKFIGELGKACTLKLALNQLIASLTASFSLSLGIILKSEIETDIFMDILRQSALYAPTFDKKLSNMLNHSFDNPNFPTKHLLKDIDLIKETSENLNLNTSALNGVKVITEKALEMGFDEKDYSAIFEAVFNK